MPYMIKKGYTLLELLVVMIILCGLFLITLNRDITLNLDQYYLANEILVKESEAILTHQRQDIDDYYNKYLNNNLYINENGHINRAQTIEFDNHKIIVHLGNGYLTHE